MMPWKTVHLPAYVTGIRPPGRIAAKGINHLDDEVMKGMPVVLSDENLTAVHLTETEARLELALALYAQERIRDVET